MEIETKGVKWGWKERIVESGERRQKRVSGKRREERKQETEGRRKEIEESGDERGNRRKEKRTRKKREERLERRTIIEEVKSFSCFSLYFYTSVLLY